MVAKSSSADSDSDATSEDLNLQQKLIEESMKKAKSPRANIKTVNKKAVTSYGSSDSSSEDEGKQNFSDAMLKARQQCLKQLKMLESVNNRTKEEVSSDEEKPKVSLKKQPAKLTAKAITKPKQGCINPNLLQAATLSAKKGLLQKIITDSNKNIKQKTPKGILKSNIKQEKVSESDDDRVFPLSQAKLKTLNQDISSLDASFSNAFSSTQIPRSQTSDSETDSPSQKKKIVRKVSPIKKIESSDVRPNSAADSKNKVSEKYTPNKRKSKNASNTSETDISTPRITAAEYFKKEKLSVTKSDSESSESDDENRKIGNIPVADKNKKLTFQKKESDEDSELDSINDVIKKLNTFPSPIKTKEPNDDDSESDDGKQRSKQRSSKNKTKVKLQISKKAKSSDESEAEKNDEDSSDETSEEEVDTIKQLQKSRSSSNTKIILKEQKKQVSSEEESSEDEDKQQPLSKAHIVYEDPDSDEFEEEKLVIKPETKMIKTQVSKDSDSDEEESKPIIVKKDFKKQKPSQKLKQVIQKIKNKSSSEESSEGEEKEIETSKTKIVYEDPDSDEFEEEKPDIKPEIKTTIKKIEMKKKESSSEESSEEEIVKTQITARGSQETDSDESEEELRQNIFKSTDEKQNVSQKSKQPAQTKGKESFSKEKAKLQQEAQDSQDFDSDEDKKEKPIIKSEIKKTIKKIETKKQKSSSEESSEDEVAKTKQTARGFQETDSDESEESKQPAERKRNESFSKEKTKLQQKAQKSKQETVTKNNRSFLEEEKRKLKSITKFVNEDPNSDEFADSNPVLKRGSREVETSGSSEDDEPQKHLNNKKKTSLDEQSDFFSEKKKQIPKKSVLQTKNTIDSENSNLQKSTLLSHKQAKNVKKSTTADSSEESNEESDDQKSKSSSHIQKRGKEELSASSSDDENISSPQIPSTKKQISPSKILNNSIDIPEKIDSGLKGFVSANAHLKSNKYTNFTLDHLNEDHEIWLMQCPKILLLQSLVDQRLDFKTTKKLKVDGVKYEYSAHKNNNESKISLLASKSENNPKLCTKIIEPVGKLIVHELLKSNSAEIQVPEKTKVKPPANLKIRHPLFGKDYETKIELGDDIQNKLLQAEIERRKATHKEKKKKKKRSLELQKAREEKQKEEILDKNEMIFQLLSQTDANNLSSKKSKKRKLAETDIEVFNKKIKIEKPDSNDENYFGLVDEAMSKSPEKKSKKKHFSQEISNNSVELLFTPKKSNKSSISKLDKTADKLNKSGDLINKLLQAETERRDAAEKKKRKKEKKSLELQKSREELDENKMIFEQLSQTNITNQTRKKSKKTKLTETDNEVNDRKIKIEKLDPDDQSYSELVDEATRKRSKSKEKHLSHEISSPLEELYLTQKKKFNKSSEDLTNNLLQAETQRREATEKKKRKKEKKSLKLQKTRDELGINEMNFQQLNQTDIDDSPTKKHKKTKLSKTDYEDFNKQIKVEKPDSDDQSYPGLVKKVRKSSEKKSSHLVEELHVTPKKKNKSSISNLDKIVEKLNITSEKKKKLPLSEEHIFAQTRLQRIEKDDELNDETKKNIVNNLVKVDKIKKEKKIKVKTEKEDSVEDDSVSDKHNIKEKKRKRETDSREASPSKKFKRVS